MTRTPVGSCQVTSTRVVHGDWPSPPHPMGMAINCSDGPDEAPDGTIYGLTYGSQEPFMVFFMVSKKYQPGLVYFSRPQSK